MAGRPMPPRSWVGSGSAQSLAAKTSSKLVATVPVKAASASVFLPRQQHASNREPSENNRGSIRAIRKSLSERELTGPVKSSSSSTLSPRQRHREGSESGRNSIRAIRKSLSERELTGASQQTAKRLQGGGCGHALPVRRSTPPCDRGGPSAHTAFDMRSPVSPRRASSPPCFSPRSQAQVSATQLLGQLLALRGEPIPEANTFDPSSASAAHQSGAALGSSLTLRMPTNAVASGLHQLEELLKEWSVLTGTERCRPDETLRSSCSTCAVLDGQKVALRSTETIEEATAPAQRSCESKMLESAVGQPHAGQRQALTTHALTDAALQRSETLLAELRSLDLCGEAEQPPELAVPTAEMGSRTAVSSIEGPVAPRMNRPATVEVPAVFVDMLVQMWDQLKTLKAQAAIEKTISGVPSNASEQTPARKLSQSMERTPTRRLSQSVATLSSPFHQDGTGCRRKSTVDSSGSFADCRRMTVDSSASSADFRRMTVDSSASSSDFRRMTVDSSASTADCRKMTADSSASTSSFASPLDASCSMACSMASSSCTALLPASPRASLEPMSPRQKTDCREVEFLPRSQQWPQLWASNAKLATAGTPGSIGPPLAQAPPQVQVLQQYTTMSTSKSGLHLPLRQDHRYSTAGGRSHFVPGTTTTSVVQQTLLITETKYEAAHHL